MLCQSCTEYVQYKKFFQKTTPRARDTSAYSCKDVLVSTSKGDRKCLINHPPACVLEQHELNTPCWVFTTPRPPTITTTTHTKTHTKVLSPNVLEGGKCAGVDKIRISPKVLEDAWLFNNNRSVTVVLCNYEHKGRPFFCLLKQHSSSTGLQDDSNDDQVCVRTMTRYRVTRVDKSAAYALSHLTVRTVHSICNYRLHLHA